MFACLTKTATFYSTPNRPIARVADSTAPYLHRCFTRCALRHVTWLYRIIPLSSLYFAKRRAHTARRFC